ncbi:6061_t:CDS:2, partial [Paraglomus occultum]
QAYESEPADNTIVEQKDYLCVGMHFLRESIHMQTCGNEEEETDYDGNEETEDRDWHEGTPQPSERIPRPIDGIMTVRSYIEIDSGLETKMLDEEEIIAAVHEAPSDMTRKKTRVHQYQIKLL